MRAFQKTRTSDPGLSRVQDNVQQTLRDVTGIRLLKGRLIEDVEITAGDTVAVEHKLGRAVDWLLVSKNGPADVWENVDDNEIPTKQLLLESDQDVTVNLWVF